MLLSISFFNAALRVDIDSDITLFRIALPLFILYLFFRSLQEFVNLILVILGFTILQAISFASSPYSFYYINIVSYINYVIMFIFAIYIYSINKTFSGKSIELFVTSYIYILIVFSIIQYLFDVNVINIQDRPALNSWYGNENDASLALTAFILYTCRFNLFRKNFLIILSSIVIIWYNDSRTCLLTLTIVPFYLIYRKYGWKYSSLLTINLTIVFIIAFGIFGLLDEAFEGVRTFFLAVQHGIMIVAELKVIPGFFSSVDVRSMAATLAILDFLEHPFFGVGVGNTYTLIDINSVVFNGTISSIHNMPLMILAEMGIIGSLFIIFCLKYISKIPLTSFIFWLGIFSLASVSSAAGFIVNYFTLMMLVLVVSTPLAATPRKKALIEKAKSKSFFWAKKYHNV